MSEEAANVQPLTDAQVDVIMSTLNSHVSRRNFANLAGFQYGTDRDVWTVAGYPKSSELEGKEGFQRYLGYYERNELAGRIVDKFAKDTWSKEHVLVEKDVEESELGKAYEELSKRLGLTSKYLRGDILGRVGHYSVLFIGFRGDSTDADLKNEAPAATQSSDILYVTAFSEWSASIKTVEDDPTNERFGLPKTYEIDLSGDLSGARESGESVRGSGVDAGPSGTLTEVHHSRIIHLAEGLLQNDVFGRPALQRGLNRLIDMQKVSASTGEAFWQIVDRILAAKLDPNSQISQPDLDKLGEKLEEIMHDLRRQFIGQGVELEWKGGEAPDPSKAADMYFTLLAVSGDYPKRVFIGNETGERASSEDLKAYFGTVGERRTNYAEVSFVREFIDKVGGALPDPESEENGYEVIWEPLFTESAKDIAETNRINAEAARALAGIGGDPAALVGIDTEGNVRLLELDPDETEPEVDVDTSTDEPDDGSDDNDTDDESDDAANAGAGKLRRFTRST